jgi:hypothetical protein
MKHLFLLFTVLFSAVLISCEDGDPIPADDGLVADLSFDDGTANDQTGNGHNGIVFGATAATGRNGVAQTAYKFFSTIPGAIAPIDSTEFKYIAVPIVPTSDVTGVSFWFNAYELSTSWNSLISFYTASRPGFALQDDFVVGSGIYGDYPGSTGSDLHYLYNYTINDVPTVLKIEGSSAVSDDTWHHMYFEFDLRSKQKLTAYLDGVLVGSIDLTGEFNDYNYMYIGSSIGATGTWQGIIGAQFVGAIDDVKVYNQPKTAADVLDMFTN